MTAVQSGQTAAIAIAIAKELRAEHKRWNLPLLLLSWKDGKVVSTKR